MELHVKLAQLMLQRVLQQLTMLFQQLQVVQLDIMHQDIIFVQVALISMVQSEIKLQELLD